EERPAVVRDLRVDPEVDRVGHRDLDGLLRLLVEAGLDLGFLEGLAVVVAGGLGAHRVVADRHGGERRRLVAGGEDKKSRGHGTKSDADSTALTGEERNGHGPKAIGRSRSRHAGVRRAAPRGAQQPPYGGGSTEREQPGGDGHAQYAVEGEGDPDR